MKILIVISKYLPEYSGASYRIHTLYRALKQSDPALDAEILCAGVELRHADRFTIDGLKIRRIASFAPATSHVFSRVLGEWLEALQTWRVLLTGNFDVLHVIGTAPVCAAALYYAHWRKTPVMRELVTKEAPVSPGLPVLGKIWRPALKTQTVVTVISKELADHAETRGWGENIWCRLNPVDTEKFFPAPSSTADRARLCPIVQDGDILIGMIANFTPNKNQIFLIEVLRRLDERFKLFLAGPFVDTGSLGGRNRAYMQEIEGAIEEGGLRDRVFVHKGFIEARECMNMFDVYAMPNTQEGLGTPFLEALACGVPVVANAGERAFRDMHAELGLSRIEDLDPDSWAQAFKSVLEFSSSQRRQASALIQEKASLGACVNHYYKLLSSLRSSKPGQTISVAEILDLPAPDLKRDKSP